MGISRQGICRASRRHWAAVAGLTLAAAAGCATPGGSGWANFKTRREIETIASDDSFPSAAEAGLTGTGKSLANGS